MVVLGAAELGDLDEDFLVVFFSAASPDFFVESDLVFLAPVADFAATDFDFAESALGVSAFAAVLSLRFLVPLETLAAST